MTGLQVPIRERRIHLAIGTHGGLADDRDSGVGGFFAYGLTLGVVITPNLTLGITRLGVGYGFSSIEGAIRSADFVPYVEGAFFASDVIQPFSRLGVAMHARGETNARPGRFGASMFLSLGVRYRPLPWLALELEAAAYVPFGETDFGVLTVVPFTVAGTLGGGVGFYF